MFCVIAVILEVTGCFPVLCWQTGLLENLDAYVCPQEKLTCMKSVLVSVRDYMQTCILVSSLHNKKCAPVSSVVTGSIARSASRRYLVYSEADFEVFRPTGATRCTDGGEICRGGGYQRSPPPCQISPPSVQRQGCRTPKTEIFTQL